MPTIPAPAVSTTSAPAHVMWALWMAGSVPLEQVTSAYKRG
jgi:hypothetical protein